MPRRAQFDESAISQVAAAQAGLITAAQLREIGVPPASLAYRSRPGGMLTRILPGVHILGRGKPTTFQRELAALFFAGERSQLTGLSALRYYGIDGGAQDDTACGIVHVLIPHSSQRTGTSFVRVERTRALQQPLRSATHPALPLAPAGRAVLDATRHMTFAQDAVVVATHAVRLGITTADELEEELKRGPRQGSAALREAIPHLKAGVWSLPEAQLRPLMASAGLPEAVWNRPLFGPDGRFVAIPDAFLDEVALAIEVDSRSHHADYDDWDKTVRRQAAYAQVGVLCVPLTPRQIRDQPNLVTRTLLEAYEQARGRPRPNVTLGSVVPRDLAPTYPVPWGG